MAGSAPSAFIFLMTALIVSASVSIILVDSWKGIANTYADNRDKAALDAKTEFSFAGNPMMVNFDDSTNQIMVFYLQNTGQVILEDSIGGVFVDGVRPATSVASAVVGGGDWAPGELLRLTLTDSTSPWTYADGDEVVLMLVANSVISKGVRGTYSLTLTVRLV
jgi:archaellum component FlaG (FlaF/FlaG flagellin family)